MKKIISLLLILTMMCAIFAACSNAGNNETTATKETTAKTNETTSAKETTQATDTTASTAKPEPKPEPSENIFSGKTDIDTVLDKVIARAAEIEKDDEYGIGTIESYHLAVDEDSCETILGLSVEEFQKYVESAMESKPEASWYTHSVVVVKFKDGADVKAVSEKIMEKTEAVRFGCLRPEAIVGARTGNYLVFTTSSKEMCDDVYKAVAELAGEGTVRIDREKNWSDSGLMG